MRLLFLILLVNCAFHLNAQQSRISFLNYQQRVFGVENYEPSTSLTLPSIQTETKLFAAAKKKPYGWVRRKVFHESFAILKDESNDFEVRANPIWNLEIGPEKVTNQAATDNKFVNGRGMMLDGHFLDKFFFQTGFIETQAEFPSFIQNSSLQHKSIPTVGRSKYDKDANQFDFGYAWGSFAYQPNKNITFWIGNQPLFCGSGYRSMFYSDFAPNAPYLRADVSLLNKKLNYTATYSSLSNSQRYGQSSRGASVTYSTEAALLRKPSTFTATSFNITEKIKISYLEATIWKKVDDGKDQSVNTLRYNPIPLVNMLANADDANTLFGIQLDVNIGKKIAIYNQTLSSNDGKLSGQFGIKAINLVNHLFAQVEYNFASNGSYLSATDSLMHFTNQSYSLAHPLLSGFSESVVILGYKFKSLIAEVKMTQAKINGNYSSAARTNFIDNTFDLANFNSTSNLLTIQPSLTWIVNREANLSLKLGAIYRDLMYSNSNNKVSFVYISVFSSIFNYLKDY